jgi:hypothetical protein
LGKKHVSPKIGTYHFYFFKSKKIHIDYAYNDNEVIDLLYVYRYSTKNKIIELHSNIIKGIKYVHSTKSCDISQLKNVNRHGRHGLNQHSPIGHDKNCTKPQERTFK